MTKLRVGIVGTGYIADFHHAGFAQNPEVEITGMCSHQPNTPALLKKSADWGIRPYDSFEEMVKDPNMDALIIASINPNHFSQILMGMEHGKHLLIEKPVVTQVEQLNQIIEVAKSQSVVVFPGHNFVYRPAIIQARQALADGRIGRPLHASFISSHTISQTHAQGWRSQLSTGAGGALMDSGHHQVYMSLYLMGMPAKLQAFQSRLVLTHMEGEDIAQVNMLYPNGALGCLMQSWCSDHASSISGVKIMGDQGELVVTDDLYVNGEKQGADASYEGSFYHQSLHFADAVLRGSQPLSTLEDARDCLRVICGAYQSSESHQVLSLDQ